MYIIYDILFSLFFILYMFIVNFQVNSIKNFQGAIIYNCERFQFSYLDENSGIKLIWYRNILFTIRKLNFIGKYWY